MNKEGLAYTVLRSNVTYQMLLRMNPGLNASPPFLEFPYGTPLRLRSLVPRVRSHASVPRRQDDLLRGCARRDQRALHSGFLWGPREQGTWPPLILSFLLHIFRSIFFFFLLLCVQSHEGVRARPDPPGRRCTT